jgi:hypothetical protein
VYIHVHVWCRPIGVFFRTKGGCFARNLNVNQQGYQMVYFHTKKSWFGYILDWKMLVRLFYSYLDYFVVILYINCHGTMAKCRMTQCRMTQCRTIEYVPMTNVPMLTTAGCRTSNVKPRMSNIFYNNGPNSPLIVPIWPNLTRGNNSVFSSPTVRTRVITYCWDQSYKGGTLI